MNKIVLYTLDGCNRCDRVMKEFKTLGLRYEKRVCENDSEECDGLEDFTGCDTYPIVIVVTSTKNSVYIAMQSSKEGNKKKVLNMSSTLETYSSLEEMIKRVSELLK